MFIPLDSILQNERHLLMVIALASSFGLLIANFEWLHLAKHFKNGGVYSWHVRETRSSQIMNLKFPRILSFLFSYPNILFFFILRIILIVSLFFELNNSLLFGITCILLAILSIILSIRGNEGTTGADQVTTITLLVVGLCILSVTKIIWITGIIFLSIQLIIAYSTSGWIRVFEPTWRNGEDLIVVLRQHTYGNKFVWKVGRKNKRLIKYSSLSILLFECIAPIAIFMPIEIVIVYLFIGILFHMLNAIIMGLNLFVWSFIPLYLSYFWVANELNEIIWGN